MIGIKWVVLHLVLVSLALMILIMVLLNIFCVLVDHLYVFLGEMSIRVLIF